MKPLYNRLQVAVAAVAMVAEAYPHLLQSAEITRALLSKRRYIEPDLQRLTKAGILDGVRGPQGGYRLGMVPEKITIGMIAKVIERERMIPPPVLVYSLAAIEARWMAELNAITIADLVEQSKVAA